LDFGASVTFDFVGEALRSSPRPTPASGHAVCADVKGFGAVGDGVHDDTAAFRSALLGCVLVQVPEGTYLLSGSLTIPPGAELRGVGRASTLRFNVPGMSGVQLGDGQSNASGHALRDLHVTGAGQTAVLVDNALLSLVDRVVVDGTWVDGFVFRKTWGSTFSNLSTLGDGISHASFVAGPVYNANLASNLYTSNNSVEFNFIIDGSGGASHSHGSTFQMLTAQGGDVGLFVGDYTGLAITGLYTENVAQPVVLGDFDRSKKAVDVHVSGASLSGPYPHHRAYGRRMALLELSYAQSCSFNALDLQGIFGADDWVYMTVVGDGKGAVATARTRTDGSIHSVEVLTPGSGYTRAAVTFGGVGKGATATVMLDGGRVSKVELGDRGTGYNGGTPVAIRYRAAGQILINSWYFSSGRRFGLASPLYPWIVRHPKAVAGSGLNVAVDRSYLNPEGSESRLVRPQGFGAKHFRVELDTSGTPLATSYEPPVFP
jgi:hypothetical protein